MPVIVTLLTSAVVCALAIKVSGNNFEDLASRISKVNASAKTSSPIVGDPDLDAKALQFEEMTKYISNSTECFPLHVQNLKNIDILYQYCSEHAYFSDGVPVRISNTFNVPERLARRFNFWRRIYSLWSIDQYLIHPSDYPEVVFEAYDVKRFGKKLGHVAEDRMITRFARIQKAKYRRLLWKMHKYRNQEERFSPAMKRIAKSMAHIKTKHKYRKAARMLRLQRGQRDFIATGLKQAKKYLPAIEREFVKQKVPPEIAKIAFVESSFNLRAVSKVGASGVFQIMPETGEQYLTVSKEIDERNDPIKASKAAAKLLKMNYNMTGRWPLAVSAYNHGVGTILKACKRAGSKNMAYLIENYRGALFGFASRNFYPSFLGVLATLKDSDRIFPEIRGITPISYFDIKLRRPSSIRSLKKKYHLSTQEFALYNPDISRDFVRNGGTLPRGHVIKVPIRTKSSSKGKPHS